MLDAVEESGESLAGFAKREGWSAERLYRWRRKLTKQAFVEIERMPVGVLGVVVATERVVRVPSDLGTDPHLRRKFGQMWSCGRLGLGIVGHGWQWFGWQPEVVGGGEVVAKRVPLLVDEDAA